MGSQNNYSQLKLFIFLLIISVYCALLSSIITCQYNSDFTSFYSSALAARQGGNPYQSMITSFLPVKSDSLINLNPPIIILLFYPLTYFSHATALNIWLALIIVFGLIGAWVSFKLIFSQGYTKNNWLSLYTAYLFLFPTLINLSTNQVGSLLLFCLMLGYHYYLKKNDYAAGILWGFIIGLKFFPGLLIFYVLRQNRIKLLMIMGATIALCFLIPFLIYGPTIFSQYYQAMSGIEWFENPWNASVLGFIHFICVALESITWIMPAYIATVLVLLIGYVWSLPSHSDPNNINHQPFCLTLIMMLILSPLGWVYYFPILLFPLLLSWASIMEEKEPLSHSAQLWLVALFLINFPTAGLNSVHIIQYKDITQFIPFYFLGLVTLFYLLRFKKKFLPGSYDVRLDETKNSFLLFALLILAFSFIVPGTGFLLRLSRACVY